MSSIGATNSESAKLAEMFERVQQAFRLWNKPASDGNPLTGLRSYQQLQRSTQRNVRQAANDLLRHHLDRLRITCPAESQILQLRYIEDIPAHIVANRLNLSEGNVFLKQKQGIQYLAEMLCTEEVALVAEQRGRMMRRLESPTYSQLFGIQRALEQLLTTLTKPDAPWMVAIEGLGGIGKTALADALARQLIVEDTWDDLAWVTARQLSLNLGGAVKQAEKPALSKETLVEILCQQLLPDLSPQSGVSFEGRQHALRERFKSARHLLVIDNLETVLDIESLLETLRTWVKPSKVLITTRQRLLSEADIFHFPLPELVEEDALQLLRLEARNRNLPELHTATDGELHPIYQTVGGNPLALRLVVGQLHTYSLDQVLDDLQQKHGEPIHNLYSYIYRRAWDTLDEPTRTTLLMMLLTTEQGKSFDDLSLISRNKLTTNQLRCGLDLLTSLSLVDNRGDLHERRYTIHSLTRTFLHREVMGW